MKVSIVELGEQRAESRVLIKFVVIYMAVMTVAITASEIMAAAAVRITANESVAVAAYGQKRGPRTEDGGFE